MLSRLYGGDRVPGIMTDSDKGREGVRESVTSRNFIKIK